MRRSKSNGRFTRSLGEGQPSACNASASVKFHGGNSVLIDKVNLRITVPWICDHLDRQTTRVVEQPHCSAARIPVAIERDCWARGLSVEELHVSGGQQGPAPKLHRVRQFRIVNESHAEGVWCRAEFDAREHRLAAGAYF